MEERKLYVCGKTNKEMLEQIHSFLKEDYKTLCSKSIGDDFYKGYNSAIVNYYNLVNNALKEQKNQEEVISKHGFNCECSDCDKILDFNADE